MFQCEHFGPTYGTSSTIHKYFFKNYYFNFIPPNTIFLICHGSICNIETLIIIIIVKHNNYYKNLLTARLCLFQCRHQLDKI
jgi:hypothetical protein